MEICGKENILGYLVTKAFDFLDHDFLLCALKSLVLLIILLIEIKYC